MNSFAHSKIFSGFVFVSCLLAASVTPVINVKQHQASFSYSFLNAKVIAADICKIKLGVEISVVQMHVFKTYMFK